MHHDFPFSSLLLITALAAFLPLLSSWLRRLRLSLIVAEILAGMIIGQSGFDLIETGPALDFLATFGFAFLMFLSGLEIDFGAISLGAKKTTGQRLGNPISLAIANFAITVGAAFVSALGMQYLGLIQSPLVMALILSTTSLGIVLPILRERGLAATRYGQALLVTAVVADFGTLILITVVIAALSHGLTLDLLLGLLILAAYALAVRLGRMAFGISKLRQLVDELAHTTAQIRVRATFALLVAFIVLAKWLGIEVILGAFLAGTVISLLSKREENSILYQKIDAIGFGFFIPVFFIMVGVRFDLPALIASREAPWLVVALLGVAYLVKFLAALLYRLNFSWRETWAAGSLLSARLSLIIAASAIALELGAIDEAINSAVILLAVVTCGFSPFLFNRLLPAQPTTLRQGIILTSLGPMSTLLAERLKQAGEPVTLVGLGHDRVRHVTRRGLKVVEGDPTSAEVLQAAGAGTAAAVMAISSGDEVNLTVCRLAKQVFGVPNVIALAGLPEIAKRLSDAGARVVQPQLATALALEGAVNYPAAFDMLANTADGVTVREATLSNTLLHGKPLRRVEIPGEALVLGLRRRGQVLVPHGDTVLHTGDILMLVGHPEGLHQAQAWIDPPEL